jgi:tRNA (guanine37-N1)-methyltransferase
MSDVRHDRVGAAPWTATALTLFPEMFPGRARPIPRRQGAGAGRLGHSGRSTSATSRADKHQHRRRYAPIGGGAGMVMRPDVLDAAVAAVSDAPGPLVYLIPARRGLSIRRMARRPRAEEPGVKLLCGRYEGVDQRVLDKRAPLEVSLGDFVLSGGEPAALAMLDACVRLLPGVMGGADSLAETLYDKIWEAHLVDRQDDGTCCSISTAIWCTR